MRSTLEPTFDLIGSVDIKYIEFFRSLCEPILCKLNPMFQPWLTVICVPQFVQSTYMSGCFVVKPAREGTLLSIYILFRGLKGCSWGSSYLLYHHLELPKPRPGIIPGPNCFVLAWISLYTIIIAMDSISTSTCRTTEFRRLPSYRFSGYG